MDSKENIAQAISETFDAPVEAILTAELGEDGVIRGAVISDGNFYTYAADEYGIEAEYQDKATREINDYAQAWLDSLGIRGDSDRPYEFARGFLRLDAINCKVGKPCGNRCIPKDATCRKGIGSNAAQNVQAAKTQLIQGGGGKKLKLAGGIAAGVAGAAALGAAGYAGYKGRDELKKGGSEIVQELKKSGGQAKREISAGVQMAKNQIKGAKTANEAIGSVHDLNIEAVRNNPFLSKKVKRTATNALQYQKAADMSANNARARTKAVGSLAIGAEEAARSIGEGIKKSAKTAARTAKEVAKKATEDFRKKKQSSKIARR